MAYIICKTLLTQICHQSSFFIQIVGSVLCLYYMLWFTHCGYINMGVSLFSIEVLFCGFVVSIMCNGYLVCGNTMYIIYLDVSYR